MPTTKYPKYKAAIEAVEAALRLDDDNAVDKAVKMLFAAQDAEMSEDCSDIDGIFLQFRGMAGAIECHLRKGDNISAMYQMINMFEMYKDMEENAPFTELEIWPIKRLVIRTAKHIRKAAKEYLDNYQDFFNELLDTNEEDDVPTGAKGIKDNDGIIIEKCRLCNENEAKCKGSHLAPHFLIQSFLSYNGSQKRDTEVVNETQVAGYQKERKWGRAVPAENIDEVFGKVPNREKEKIKPSAVTRDFLFCDNCEKRFGFIETAYSASFKLNKPSSNGKLAYVFWLGVFWRLSVGNMAVKLQDKDEKTIGEMLNRVMPNDPKAVSKMPVQEDVCEFSYSVFYCKDTKGELSGIIGTHSPTSPYWLLLGNYVVVLYQNKSQVLPGHIANNYNDAEQWQDISFIEYWKMKQKILDANTKYEIDHMGDGEEKCIDVVKGDNVEDLPSIFGLPDREITLKDLGGKPYYQFKIPGSIQKIMTLTEEHLEADTPEKRYELIDKQLGYTQEEVQEMYTYWMGHLKLREVRKTGKKVSKNKKKSIKKKKKYKK